MRTDFVLAFCCVSLFAGSNLASAQNVKISGDVRWRYESIDDETATEVRNRDRLRARVALEAKAAEDLTVYVGMATGGTDPVSTNETFDNAASKKGFNLDYAYGDWKLGSEGLSLLAGKMKNPFFMPVGSSLIWDHDLTPEGLAFAWKQPGEGDVRAFATATYYWFNEINPGDDVVMLGLQAGIKAKGLTAGVGLYNFQNIKGTPAQGNGFSGNTSTANNYANGFSELEVFAEYSMKLSDKLPLSVGLDVVTNTEADDLNTGWLVGVKLGKCKEPGTWEVGLDYRVLEADCVVGTWTDSDHFGGGTNGAGLGLSFAYQVGEKTRLSLTYLMDTLDPDGAATSYNRLQFDLLFRF